MSYGWVITKDLLGEEDDADRSAVGVMGPRNITAPTADALKRGQGRKFRMLDDDGEVYYYGLLIHPDGEGFEPLDDFGMPDSGCTDIQFKNPAGEWKSL